VVSFNGISDVSLSRENNSCSVLTITITILATVLSAYGNNLLLLLLTLLLFYSLRTMILKVDDDYSVEQPHPCTIGGK